MKTQSVGVSNSIRQNNHSKKQNFTAILIDGTQIDSKFLEAGTQAKEQVRILLEKCGRNRDESSIDIIVDIIKTMLQHNLGLKHSNPISINSVTPVNQFDTRLIMSKGGKALNIDLTPLDRIRQQFIEAYRDFFPSFKS